MIRLVWLIVAAASALPVPLQAAKLSGAACEVALGYVSVVLAHSGKKPTIFSTESDALQDVPPSTAWLKPTMEASGRAPSPSKALLVRLVGDARSAVSTCPSVQAALRRRGIAFGKKAVEAATAGPQVFGHHGYRADIVSVGMPIVSKNGREAVLVSSAVSAPLGGGGFVHYLRRTASGKWLLVSTAGRWVA